MYVERLVFHSLSVIAALSLPPSLPLPPSLSLSLSRFASTNYGAYYIGIRLIGLVSFACCRVCVTCEFI